MLIAACKVVYSFAFEKFSVHSFVFYLDLKLARKLNQWRLGTRPNVKKMNGE
jgi:hypothetical protein